MAIHGVVVMVPVRMYGTMRRQFRIYFLHWKEVCGTQNFVKARMQKAIRISDRHLPIKPATHEFHAAADGQLGGIMKAYREWRISGDNEWLKKMYPDGENKYGLLYPYLGSAPQRSH